jgi:hypothetical protein
MKHWPGTASAFWLFFLLNCLVLLGPAWTSILDARMPEADMARHQEKTSHGFSLALDLGNVQTPWIRAKSRVELEVRLLGRNISISRLSGQLRDVRVRLDQEWRPVPDIDLQARGNLDIQNATIVLDRMQWSIGSRVLARGRLEHGPSGGNGAVDIRLRPLLGSLASVWPGLKADPGQMPDPGSLSIAGEWSGDAKQRVRAKARGLELAALAEVSRLAGWTVPIGGDARGTLDLELTASKTREGVHAQCSLEFQNAGGEALDQEVMAAGLQGRLQGSLDWTSVLQGAVSLHIEQGEALWGARYVDLGQAPVSIQAKGRITQGRAAIRDLQIEGGRFFDLHGQARLPLSRDLSGWEVQVDRSSLYLAGLNRHVQGIVPQGWRMLGRLEWTGALTGSKDGAVLHGVLRGSKMGLAGPDGNIRLSRWDFDLPVAYRFGEAPRRAARDSPESWGVLRPGRTRVAHRKWHLSPARVRVQGETLEVHGEPGMCAPGADVRLRDVRLHLPWKGQWRARGRLHIAALRSGQLLKAVPQDAAKLQGSMVFAASAREVRTTGTIRGTVFDGSLRIEELGVIRPLSASRMVTGNIHVSGLDLEPLSQSLEVGRVTGRMDIDVDRLGIAYGQPVRFHLRARSVDDPDVSRRISLQAINSLSIIGTGRGLSGVGIKLYANFFEQFPYQRIGLSCVLANDVFSLSGLIADDGVEYIVKRGLTGINVINTNPNNMIAFSDMLKRLERVFAQSEK